MWSELLIVTSYDRLVLWHPPSPAHFISVCLNTLLLGGIFCLVAIFGQKLPGKLAKFERLLWLPPALLILNAIRGVITYEAPGFRLPTLVRLFGPAGAAVVCALAGALGVGLAIRYSGRLVRIAAMLLLLLCPLVVANMAQAVWAVFSGGTVAAAVGGLRVEAGETIPPRRVVWVILDEWDQRLSFDDRPAGMRLPEMDRLRGQSLWAVDAYPPGGSTLLSVPALTTGLPVAKAEPVGDAQLRLTITGFSSPVEWGTQPTVFSQAARLGYRPAVVGWYLPYCRLFGDVVSSCDSWEMGWRYNVHGAELAQILLNQTRSLVETDARSVFGQSLYTLQHIRTHREHLERSKAAVANARLGLVLLHSPIPHAPFFFDPATTGFTLRNYSPADYFSALLLADRTLGELRRAIEEAGLSDRTSLVLTSDHAYRSADLVDGKKDPRVPFVLKLAGQNRSVVHPRPFNTLVTAELILAVLRSEIRSPEQASAWLSAHGSNTLKQ